MISSEVTFETSADSEKEDPIFQQFAILCNADQAVASQS